MKAILGVLLLMNLFTYENVIFCRKKNIQSVSVPIVLDHNRMLVNAEIQRKDKSWRKVRLWVDSGSPSFFMSESLARDLGIDLSATEDSSFKSSNFNIQTPPPIRISGKDMNFDGVNSRVMFQPFWLYSTMHIDGNLPSTVLKNYHIVFDYPQKLLTIVDPGVLKPQGISSPATINPSTGIIQIDAVIGDDSLSFALDNGASYSFMSEEKLLHLSKRYSDWPRITGTTGGANMWGWWPSNEQNFPVVRLPEIKWGQVELNEIGIVGVSKFSPNGPSLGEWYSQKTARSVDGFLGANVLKQYRVEIDYANKLVYFEKGTELDSTEMDLVGISLKQLADSTYQIVGVVKKEGKLIVEGVEPGDILISIGDYKTRGETMGNVVDALRGKPGDIRVLWLKRNGKQFKIETKVEHCL